MVEPAICPVCRAKNARKVYKVRDLPVVCNQLWPDKASAHTAPRGDIDLVICDSCAFVWNLAFEPERMVYAPGYENALHYSPSFRNFANGLAQSLIGRFDLAGKHIVEIGCGDGFMLSLMVKHGVASATGFDPTMAGKTSEFGAQECVEIVPEYFGSDHLDRPYDAIICRHVLEHLDDPMQLLSDLRRHIGDRDVPVYFEVPNATWMLDSVSMWDVIYEHVGYWSAPSLENAFRRAGFQPTRVVSGYDDQFLMIEALPTPTPFSGTNENAGKILEAARNFSAKASVNLEFWGNRLSEIEGKAVIWGAGSKGITFANAIGAPAVKLSAMIDLNPRKHGLYVPSVGIPVVSPDALLELSPSTVIISNGLYFDEIKSQVLSTGLVPDFEVIAN